MRTLIAVNLPTTEAYVMRDAVAACPWSITFVVCDGSEWPLCAARDLHVPSISYNLKTPEVAPLMIEDAEALLAIGDSPLIEEDRKRRLRIHIFNVDQNKHQEEDWV
jgi:hypothetical protein